MELVTSPGNGSRYWILTGVGEDATPWVALPDYARAAAMEWRRHVTPGYAAEKLGLGAGDAVAVAAALNAAAKDAGALVPSG